MRWSELDLEAGVWTLPGTRTKNARPHPVPLPATALAILTRRRAAITEDEPRVFPGLTLQGHAHQALGALHVGYTWKDLRRTLATRLAGLGFDETTIGRVLSHARVTVTARHYNQYAYLDETRRALVAWDAELQRILTHRAKAGATVLPMRAR
jgi:integrase